MNISLFALLAFSCLANATSEMTKEQEKHLIAVIDGGANLVAYSTACSEFDDYFETREMILHRVLGTVYYEVWATRYKPELIPLKELELVDAAFRTLVYERLGNLIAKQHEEPKKAAKECQAEYNLLIEDQETYLRMIPLDQFYNNYVQGGEKITFRVGTHEKAHKQFI